MAKPAIGTELFDAFETFEAGINSGIAPRLLAKNQLAFMNNGTLRGTYPLQRPPFRTLTINYGGSASLQAAVEQGLWQGCTQRLAVSSATAAIPNEVSIVAQIGGRLFQFIMGTGSVVTCKEVTIAGDPNSSTLTQAWLWQAEHWVIVNNGQANPIFLDLDTHIAVRSNSLSRVQQNAVIGASFTIPAVGANVTINFTGGTSGAGNPANGTTINVLGVGQFSVINNAAFPNVICANINALPVGGLVTAPGTITWVNGTPQLPPGRMGAYWRGRIWMALTDGTSFIAGDQVGGSSGTFAQNFKDAILNITENIYLAGGGNFFVPGNVGQIQAIVPTATLDSSLGQGPLAILTDTTVFSVNAPVDRLTWQNLTNPILTESLLSNGGVGQNSTVPANGDTLFRAIDGIRSLILGRRDFDTWGNVPQSREVDRIVTADSPSLLPFGSAIVFDNRLLMTAKPTVSNQGTFHPGMIALNFDPLSSLQGKLPSIYDGVWQGINVLQLTVGSISNVQRGFAFHFNNIAVPNRIELWEILTTPKDSLISTYVPTFNEIYDNGSQPVTMYFESPELVFGLKDDRDRALLQMQDGEIWVDSLIGTVVFQSFYKPDQYPCWIPWFSWEECSNVTGGGNLGFRPRMGMGKPPLVCDPNNANRPLSWGYTFQFKLIVTGHCIVKGARFRATVMAEPMIAKPNCIPICTT